MKNLQTCGYKSSSSILIMHVTRLTETNQVIQLICLFRDPEFSKGSLVVNGDGCTNKFFAALASSIISFDSPKANSFPVFPPVGLCSSDPHRAIRATFKLGPIFSSAFCRTKTPLVPWLTKHPRFQGKSLLAVLTGQCDWLNVHRVIFALMLPWLETTLIRLVSSIRKIANTLYVPLALFGAILGATSRVNIKDFGALGHKHLATVLTSNRYPGIFTYWFTPPEYIIPQLMGAGTVALVALEQNRQFIGIELNEAYVRLAEKRIATVQPTLWQREVQDEHLV